MADITRARYRWQVADLEDLADTLATPLSTMMATILDAVDNLTTLLDKPRRAAEIARGFRDILIAEGFADADLEPPPDLAELLAARIADPRRRALLAAIVDGRLAALLDAEGERR